MKIAVCYARYSSDNQRQESITAQLRQIYDYAAKNDITIIKAYIDEAQSGTTDDRDHFQEMISELPCLKPDFVLVHKLDRFARNKYDAAFYRREIKKVYARLIAVEQDFGEGPEAELMEGILEGFAEYFSSNLGREVKKGLTENAIQGKHIGGIPPLGLDVDAGGHYVINEDEAPAVRLIFQRKLEGCSHKEIQSELNKLGYKTKARGPKRPPRPFGTNSLHDILRNEKYIGTLVIRKTSPRNSRVAADPSKTMRIENVIPRIIEQSVFERVQEMLNQSTCTRHREDKPMRYLLTGIIHCGVCGGAMSGITVRKNKEAPTRGYYQCGKAKRTGECGNRKRYRKDNIENEVLDYIEREVRSIKNVNKMADDILRKIKRQYPEESKHKELKAAMHKANQEFINLTNAIAAGADPRFLADRLNEAGQRKEELQRELEQQDTALAISKDEIIRFLQARQAIKIERDNEVSCAMAIREAIKEVIVFLDKVVKVKPRGMV